MVQTSIRSAEPALPPSSLPGQDYFRKFRALYPHAGQAVEVEIIVTTESLWPRCREAADPVWTRQPDASPLVVASRLMI